MVLLNQMHIATKGSKIDISSEKKLERFALKFSGEIKKGNIIFLFGEIGVGKTTFVKYLINCLQLELKNKITEVTSPTFNIMNEYIVGDLTIKHYDLFRIKSDRELEDLNLFDNEDNSILFIEWPQKIKKEPNFLIKLFFEYEDEYKKRFIKFKIDETK